MANLITVDEYKELEGIVSSKQDAKLELLVPWVSQLVKTYCGNSIIDYYTTEKVESFNVNYPTTGLQLTESPILNISLVEERNSYGSSYVPLTTAAFEYYLDDSTDTIIRTSSGTATQWAQGPGSVRVTYTAGYPETPGDLKLAVADIITYYLTNEHRPRQTMSGSTRENQDSSIRYRDSGFPMHIRRVLELYRIIW